MKLKTILLSVGAGILLLLVLSAGFLLYKGVSQFSAAESKLRKSERELKNYYSKDPFPSLENVEREKQNTEVLQRWFGDVLAALQKGQVDPDPISPAKFMTRYNDKKNALNSEAERKGLILPADFAFGFQRYSISGALPAPDNVPRLTQQLTIIELLCRTMFKAGVKEIKTIERDEFEGSATERTASGGVPGKKRPFGFGATAQVEEKAASTEAGLIGKGEMYGAFQFKVTFKATESAIVQILNALAAHPMFVVVTSVQIEKEQDDVLPPRPRWVGDSQEASEVIAAGERDHLSRHQRLVSGPNLEKPMVIRLNLKVFRFVAAPASGEK